MIVESGPLSDTDFIGIPPPSVKKPHPPEPESIPGGAAHPSMLKVRLWSIEGLSGGRPSTANPSRLPDPTPRGEPVRPSRTIPTPEGRGIHGWGIPFALSGVEGSQERNGWSALLPRRGDRPLTLPGAEGPLTLRHSKGRVWGGPRFANPSRPPQHHPTPFSPLTIPRPREESIQRFIAHNVTPCRTPHLLPSIPCHDTGIQSHTSTLVDL